MSRHNAAAKRRPKGFLLWYAHCSWCGWLELEAVSKEDADAKAAAHNEEAGEAA